MQSRGSHHIHFTRLINEQIVFHSSICVFCYCCCFVAIFFRIYVPYKKNPWQYRAPTWIYCFSEIATTTKSSFLHQRQIIRLFYVLVVMVFDWLLSLITVVAFIIRIPFHWDLNYVCSIQCVPFHKTVKLFCTTKSETREMKDENVMINS